jgi:hypothetical protein
MLHAREGAQPRLGFREGEAYRGRRGQARAGLGRGEVGEDGCRRRSCMQELGLGRGFRWGSDGYGNGDVGSASPARDRERVRPRRCGGAPSVQRRSREGVRNGRRQPPPLPSIYRSSDELCQWIGVGCSVERLGE